jgi:hypothetical protein
MQIVDDRLNLLKSANRAYHLLTPPDELLDKAAS